MYEVVEDPYCYPGTSVLPNLLDIRDANTLGAFEEEITAQRAAEPLPRGRFGISHFKAIHHHLFQDVYAWAGRCRTVRIDKSGSMFCYPENIATELQRLFSWLKHTNYLRSGNTNDFIERCAYFLSEINAIHAFRDGNGRAQLGYVTMLAAHAGQPFRLERMEPGRFLNAMIASFHGRQSLLISEIHHLTRP